MTTSGGYCKLSPGSLPKLTPLQRGDMEIMVFSCLVGRGRVDGNSTTLFIPSYEIERLSVSRHYPMVTILG